jgi:hypothetical protein
MLALHCDTASLIPIYQRQECNGVYHEDLGCQLSYGALLGRR